jgi:3-hydroxyethyl bacteriochlorophyllide a dehydrogenase
MDTHAVVIVSPRKLELQTLPLAANGSGEVLVDVELSGISTGTERLLWSGEMPEFPGMGYPLVPGYESIGTVARADAMSGLSVGDRVFVPGASCYGSVRGLFGGTASRVSVAPARLTRIGTMGEEATLLALAATAEHALASGSGAPADLIVGHGVLGRLLARLSVLRGGAPVVWETNPERMGGERSYRVTEPEADPRRDYQTIYDASGDPTAIDRLIGRLRRGGELVLAGFYPGSVSFAFPAAFMREVRVRIAAEWQPADLEAVLAYHSAARLDLDGLVTHRMPASRAALAYETAFTDPSCLKMLIDWRSGS